MSATLPVYRPPDVRRFVGALKGFSRANPVLLDPDRTIDQIAGEYECVVAGRDHRLNGDRCKRCGRDVES